MKKHRTNSQQVQEIKLDQTISRYWNFMRRMAPRVKGVPKIRGRPRLWATEPFQGTIQKVGEMLWFVDDKNIRFSLVMLTWRCRWHYNHTCSVLLTLNPEVENTVPLYQRQSCWTSIWTPSLAPQTKKRREKTKVGRMTQIITQTKVLQRQQSASAPRPLSLNGP